MNRFTFDQEVEFQHLIDMPNSNCVFCSTRVKTTGRMKLFLVFNGNKKIYIRNGVNETWDEIHSEEQYEDVLNGFKMAIAQRRIPCFVA